MAFSVGLDIDATVRTAAELVHEEDWAPGVNHQGDIRYGSWVAELTDLMDLSAWPLGSRVIARREHPHPGATQFVRPGQWFSTPVHTY